MIRNFKCFMRCLSVLAFAALAAGAVAQDAATISSVLDAKASNVGSVYAATYSTAENKFIGSNAGTAIRVYNGDTGVYESDLNLTSVSPAASGLGFFALAAGNDGSIFGYEDGGGATKKLYQWDNIADASATEAAVGVPFSRTGHVIGTGNSTIVALTGDANNGSIHLFNTANDVNYALLETIPAAAAVSKSAFAINDTATVTYAVGDTGQTIKRGVKTGSSWALDTNFVAPVATNGAACLAYDSDNNLLFSFKGTEIVVMHGTTGAQLASVTVTNGLNATPGYAGSGIMPVEDVGGTVWLTGRGTTATEIVTQKLTYTVTPTPTAAQDWTLFE